MTVEERAIRLEKRSTQPCVVLLWDSGGVIRAVRGGRVRVLSLEPSDFGNRLKGAVRWASKHFRVNVVYVGSGRNDEVEFKRYRRPTEGRRR
jgi:hypothetical protein